MLSHFSQSVRMPFGFLKVRPPLDFYCRDAKLSLSAKRQLFKIRTHDKTFAQNTPRCPLTTWRSLIFRWWRDSLDSVSWGQSNAKVSVTARWLVHTHYDQAHKFLIKSMKELVTKRLAEVVLFFYRLDD
jgi:hypothetical protein